MTTLRVRPQADRDTDQTAEYYAREAGVDVALEFLTGVERAFRRIAEAPLLGASVKAFEPRLAGLRFWPVPGFETLLVFYIPSPAVVEVVRVLHGARDLQQLLGD